MEDLTISFGQLILKGYVHFLDYLAKSDSASSEISCLIVGEHSLALDLFCHT